MRRQGTEKEDLLRRLGGGHRPQQVRRDRRLPHRRGKGRVSLCALLPQDGLDRSPPGQGFRQHFGAHTPSPFLAAEFPVRRQPTDAGDEGIGSACNGFHGPSHAPADRRRAGADRPSPPAQPQVFVSLQGENRARVPRLCSAAAARQARERKTPFLRKNPQMLLWILIKTSIAYPSGVFKSIVFPWTGFYTLYIKRTSPPENS